MDWESVLFEGLAGSADILLKMFLIMMPLIIALEMLRESGYLERISNRLSFVARLFSASKGAAFPITVGGIFGLSYGGGVLLEHKRENTLTEKENKQVAEIVGLNHAWVEDTILFAIVGANLFIVLFTRIVLAAIVEKLASLKELLLGH